MTRDEATKLLRAELDKYGLSNWKLRLSPDQRFLGLCSHKDKTIFLNLHHIDIHPIESVTNTIKHEVAHAIVGPEHGHDDVWAAKAKEIGCVEIRSCASVGLPAHIIDAIRSGDTVETELITETVTTQKVKYTVGKLTDKCPECGKVAKEKSSFTVRDVKYILLECNHLITKAIPKSTPFHTLTTEPDNGNFQCKPDEHTWDKNTCITCAANRPFEFQVEGMKFIEHGLSVQRGVGIFDEMGLGKTIQALGYIKFHPESCPVLYVVKSGIKFQWYMAILRWLGIKYLPQVIETGKDGVRAGLKSYIISYDLLRRFDLSKFEKVGIKTVILDECQLVKNPDSTRTAEVRKVVRMAEHVIPLSGTPWKNRGEEFFVALNMLDPVKFNSFERFKHNWVEFYYDGPKMKQGGIRNIPKFKEYTKELIIRRERTEVMPELPLVNRVKLYCSMEKHAADEYDKEVNEFVKYYNSAVIGGEEDSFATSQGILARLARLRQITGLAKIPVTLEDIEEFFEGDKKLVVFVHHIKVGEILMDQAAKLDVIKEKNIPVIALTGGMNAEARFAVQEQFNSTPQILLIASTLSAGEGLNLQTCSDCILHERQWNPSSEEQAEGRFIRIGQEAKSVTAKYALAVDSVDDIFDGIVARKRVQFHQAMNKGELVSWNQQSIIKELSESIVKMASKRK